MNIEKKIEKPEFEVPKELMEGFLGEIAEFKKKEEIGNVGSGHLTGIVLEDLTGEDFAMWQRIKHYPQVGKFDQGDLDAYAKGVVQGGNKSRLQFFAFIRNRFTPIWMMEDFDKMKPKDWGDEE
ncbi:MAG: hypothetical protein WCT25_02415 [Candidatus Paceibacterota bacterium]|jgi:hypothetical protein